MLCLPHSFPVIYVLLNHEMPQNLLTLDVQCDVNYSLHAYFADYESTVIHVHIQGTPGKAGPKGEQGDVGRQGARGPSGPPGTKGQKGRAVCRHNSLYLLCI